jgi:asparagine synthase (glutamine-hydrolysing)
MTQSLAHRGRDDSGLWDEVSADGTWIGLGHRRLSILDLSSAGHQPMFSESGRFSIVFNGEIYNFKELRAELASEGCRFKSNTDTEVVLHLYERLKEGCLDRLRGMFAFGIWDRQEQSLFLAQDRLGIKPLYYTEQDNRLLFASELKAILRQPDFERQMDLQALDDYLTYLYIPPPLTIFKGVRKLSPGHYLLWRGGKIVKCERYWELPTGTIDGDEADLVNEVRSLLEESVRLRMISDVPLGAFLSGGVDSSTIVGLMARQASRPIKTFSIGFGQQTKLYDELAYARQVAEYYGTDHQEIVVEPDAVNLLPSIVEGFDEPFGNPTSLLVYLLSEFTRDHVSVALAGDGGDEVFGGYPRYKGAALSPGYRKLPGWLRNSVLNKLAGFIPESSRGRHGFRRIKEFVQGNTMNPEDMYCSWVGYYTSEMKQQLYQPEFLAQGEMQESNLFLKRLFADSKKRSRNSFFDQITAVDLQSFLPHNLLTYTDRMSMAHNLEVRVPFTDHKLVEFVTQLPPALRLKGFQDKYILKQAVRDLLPDTILKRKKLGFNPPMAHWLNEDLTEVLRDCLSERVINDRGYFRYESIASLLHLHSSGQRDVSLHIWALLVLEIWQRKYLDR